MSEKGQIIAGFIFEKVSSINYLEKLRDQTKNLKAYMYEREGEESDYLNTLKELIQKDITEANKELEDYLNKLLIK